MMWLFGGSAAVRAALGGAESYQTHEHVYALRLKSGELACSCGAHLPWTRLLRTESARESAGYTDVSGGTQ